MNNNFKNPFLHFILVVIILVFSISCQNCTSTNADNKPEKKINNKSSVVVSKQIALSKEALLGKVNPAKDTGFTAIDQKYSSKKCLYLRKETYTAFRKMYDAALKDGITLYIISATRTFNEQKNIWENKWSGKSSYYGKNIATSYPDSVERSKFILSYSSMPGTSRHHWGTDMDLNSLELSYYKTDAGKKLYNWLTANASKYGFCQPYTAKDNSRPTGYEEEKWHWSYYPLSSIFLQQYKEKITYDDLKGFAGWQTAKKINIINNYVLSVNIKCQ
jgi:LAS superfamily LD-carboxypeptidase LdcB